MSSLVVTLLVAVFVASPEDGGRLPASLDLTVIRSITVLHDGRWPPLDTLARDYAYSVTGDAAYQERDAVLWLLAWTFDPDTWKEQPLIPIENAEACMDAYFELRKR